MNKNCIQKESFIMMFNRNTQDYSMFNSSAIIVICRCKEKSQNAHIWSLLSLIVATEIRYIKIIITETICIWHGSRVVTSVAFPLILRSRVRIPALGAFGKLHPLHERPLAFPACPSSAAPCGCSAPDRAYPSTRLSATTSLGLNMTRCRKSLCIDSINY